MEERELPWIKRELKEIGPQADGELTTTGTTEDNVVMSDDWWMIIDWWLVLVQ